MLALGVAVLALATIAISQFDYYGNRDIPNYIKRALREKDRYRPPVKERKRTFTNITLKEVFEKIKDITRSMNKEAKKNGYFIDYKLRMF